MLFPFLAWLAAVVAGVLLMMLRASGEMRDRWFYVSVAWFVAALCLQFGGRSDLVTAVGVGLQTLLALGLWLRWQAA